MTPDQRPPTRADVREYYRVLLGRPPENDAIVQHQLKSAPTVLKLLQNLSGSQEFLDRVHLLGDCPPHSPFSYLNSSIDVERIIQTYIAQDRRPRAGHFVNFLGVAVPTKVMSFLHDKGGQLDHLPIPSNFHADMAEWGAALRAVDLAREQFNMIELGCGWGCWMANTGVAAKKRGLRIHVSGVEGDPTHLDYARKPSR